MTLLVRDEQDIIEANLEYHLARGVDFFVVTDNLSTDETPAILARYARQGVLRVITESDDDHSQGKWVTRMARMAAAEHDADWVINNDADEFWWPRDGTLAAALASVPARYDSVLVERYNFIARPESEEPFYARMIHRYAVPSNPAEGRPLQPKACHRGHPQVTVAEGNHQVDWPGRGLELTGAGMEILHYPVRSRAQFQNKVVKGGEALERNRVLPAGIGRRWRDLLEIHRAGRFNETYATYVPDEAELADAIRDGSVVTDRRLADFFAAGEVGP